jgi:cell wall-associated NlpC family hydrolase
MNTIIAHLSVIPIRKEPDHRSEQLSQLLFGETALVTDSFNDWILIKTHFDQYAGWIERDSVSDQEPDSLSSEKLIISIPVLKVSNENNILLLPAGAEIALPEKSGSFFFQKRKWQIEKHHFKEMTQGERDDAALALSFLFAPYQWGGRTVFGIDCSGFTQLIGKIKGIYLPRDAKDQVQIGSPVKSIHSAKAGDHLFFNNQEGKITHTGIFLGEEKIIHASKSVRIDKIDEKGIFNMDRGEYSHQLNCIRRLEK